MLLLKYDRDVSIVEKKYTKTTSKTIKKKEDNKNKETIKKQ